MATYTSGEIAKICQVTVRTVQYYDKRGILSPTTLSEGGRRLYSEADVKQLKLICFLRELGLSLKAIESLLKEEDAGHVIDLVLEEQSKDLHAQLLDIHEKLNKIKQLKSQLDKGSEASLEKIGDISRIMASKKELSQMRWVILMTGIPVTLLQWFALYEGLAHGNWGYVLIWLAVAVPYGIIISRYYFKSTAYICPNCHEVFKPSFKQVFWASHTPTMRQLTCPHCHHQGFCVEIYRKEEQDERHS
ncbi:MerR family transcriptional regulator [Eremococcus coleocola]|uniref:Transcriptional regulator, MerR family n=1 Tax=Eremococcus coleocola ACS-139-V-Col8 TaxID=908337 RepID=E4KPR3_9LACT|nr:MerR family transcriptional regulator [Eremococcus coleocola]EFR31309.1 transcriptional regulator, MerR family [Eremococcus coleocola ACS-139-V-Col8]